MATPPNDAPQPADMRVYFAAQRTWLAWVRTGVTLMGLGFVVARFGLFLREIAAVRAVPDAPPAATSPFSTWIGAALLIIGVAVNVQATASFAAFARHHRRGTAARAPSLAVELILTVLLALTGLFLAAYLVVTR